MSGAQTGVSLSQLLAEVDRLERELKELGREAQRGGDYVHQLIILFVVVASLLQSCLLHLLLTILATACSCSW